VDSGRSLPVAASYLKHDNVGLGGVFFIAGVAGANEQFIAHETSRPVTSLAGLARRAEVLYRPINLSQAVHFGSHHPGQPRADVAVHTSHMRVRRKVVSGIFGKHHVTRRSAEIRRIQILHTAVGCSANNKKVDPCG